MNVRGAQQSGPEGPFSFVSCLDLLAAETPPNNIQVSALICCAVANRP